MKLLVLGGTKFVGHEVAEQAVARGWDVTCACRGESGTIPDGARLVRWDRSGDEAPAELGTDFDAVVDVARHPSYVRRAVTALPDAHWVFVSTVNVYADNSSPAMEPLVAAIHDDVDLAQDPEAYGGMKVACESLVRDGVASAAVVRPGLIVGPGDHTGRFSYWPDRLARGGEVLAPGSPDDVVQVIDGRDLAAWILELCSRGTRGDFDAVGEPMPIGRMLTEVASGVGVDGQLTWVAADFLAEHGVEPWAGPDSLPLWLPRPEYDGMLAHDPGPAVAAGLSLRPISETSRDTLGQVATGISAEREQELLDAWRSLGSRA